MGVGGGCTRAEGEQGLVVRSEPLGWRGGPGGTQVREACRGQGGRRFQNEDMGSRVSRDRHFRVSEETTGQKVTGVTETSPRTAAAVGG